MSLFYQYKGQINSRLPGKHEACSVIVQNNSVKDEEKTTLSFLSITRVSSSRIWVYWVWKLIFKYLSNLMITNNFSLQWSRLPHFLDFHFVSGKTNLKTMITLSPHHCSSFPVMYVLIHQHQQAPEWGRPELECCNRFPPWGTIASYCTRIAIFLHEQS